MADTTTCPVWCTGEHTGSEAENEILGLGWFHDSSRDVLDPAGGDGEVQVGVSRYVPEDGSVEGDAVEVNVPRSCTRMTPSEARQLASMLYIAADMAESTTA